MATGTPTRVVYPTGDGQPMAETTLHGDVQIDLRDRLSEWFADRPDVFVGRNMFVYYVEGDIRRVLAPDVYVAFGVREDPLRPIDKTWEEGRFPEVVFEITSPTTIDEDLGRKLLIYQNDWRLREYFVFDPRLEDQAASVLRGYRLTRGELRPIRPAGGRLLSKRLGLFVEQDGYRLHLLDAETGERVETKFEKAARLRDAAEAARDRALAENARLLAELAELKQRKS
jgi:Uma2 family endonuclease